MYMRYAKKWKCFMKEENIFKHLTVNTSKLLDHGFLKKGNTFYFQKKIHQNSFNLIIKVTNNEVFVDIVDLKTNDLYMPYYVTNAVGSFVGTIKEEVEVVLNDIAKNCFKKTVFKSNESEEIIRYVKDKYNDELEFLWKSSPSTAILRNKINNKWYFLITILEKAKLGLKEDGNVEIINLMINPSVLPKMIDNKNYFLAYHMNKKHWITLKLDGSINIKEILKLIDESYEISVKGKK